jgi:DNA replication initiation complex subunit (GINS family)
MLSIIVKAIVAFFKSLFGTNEQVKEVEVPAPVKPKQQPAKKSQAPKVPAAQPQKRRNTNKPAKKNGQ